MLEAFWGRRIVGAWETWVAHGWVGWVTRMEEHGVMVGGIRPYEGDATYRVTMRGDPVALAELIGKTHVSKAELS